MSYTIAGKKILNEYMALGVIGGYTALALSFSGGSKSSTTSDPSSSSSSVVTPPINASSSDEEAFVKQFLAEAESTGQKLV